MIFGRGQFKKLIHADDLENLKYIGGLHSFGSEGVSFKKFKEREKMKCLKK